MEVEVKLGQLGVFNDIFPVVDEFIGHLVDLARHEFKIDAHAFVLADDDRREVVGMSNADVVGIAPHKGFVLGIIEDPGVLSQHVLNQGPDTEPFDLPADVLETVEFSLLNRGKIDHAVQ